MDTQDFDIELTEQQEKYLEALIDGAPTIKAAALKAGIHPITPYGWRKNVDGFAELEAMSRELALDDLVEVITDFAKNGVKTELAAGGHPIYLTDKNGEIKLDENFEPIPMIRREHKVEYAKLALQAGGRIGGGADKLTIDQQKGAEGEPDHFRITFVRAENGRPARDQ